MSKEKKAHVLAWVADDLRDDETFLEKPMFGCRACYFKGRMVLALAARGEKEWQGVLIPTEHQFHESLKQDFVELEQHPVLGKWLYLPEAAEDFERSVSAVVKAIRRGDRRFGVYSQKEL